MAKGLNPVFGNRTRRCSAAFRTRRPARQAALSLSYDPLPAVRYWRGNWLPPCYYPIPLSDTSAGIARRVWWNGPAWTVLRNSSYFLWRVWDYATPEQLDYIRQTVPVDTWLRAIDDAVPGEVSRGATTFWALRLNRIALTDYIDWPDTAHLRDYRPLAKLSKAGFLDRARYSNAQPRGLLKPKPTGHDCADCEVHSRREPALGTRPSRR